MQISRVPEKGRTATTQSLNSDFSGSAYLIERLSGFSILVQVAQSSGTLAGTMKLQQSNNAFKDDAVNRENSAAIWVDIPSSDFAVSVASGTDEFLWNYDNAYYEAVRIVWDQTSGQGSMVAYFVAKE